LDSRRTEIDGQSQAELLREDFVSGARSEQFLLFVPEVISFRMR
jgi:hypothetical protein